MPIWPWRYFTRTSYCSAPLSNSRKAYCEVVRDLPRSPQVCPVWVDHIAVACLPVLLRSI
ncbi:hypothetical protein F5Y19DRAFT_436837 [Xylariaceae sp. FL1651]|nr:hypothetical protein F5Y19DRAFT_436837 [Xylariaceae sp. FL1651]